MDKMIEPTMIPFLLAVGGEKEINRVRIIEAVIIAAVISLGGYFVALPKIVETIEKNVVEIKLSQKETNAQMEIRRIATDAQVDSIKRDISDIRVEIAKRK